MNTVKLEDAEEEAQVLLPRGSSESDRTVV
jgi:hypothetical protein